MSSFINYKIPTSGISSTFHIVLRELINLNYKVTILEYKFNCYNPNSCWDGPVSALLKFFLRSTFSAKLGFQRTLKQDCV